MGSSSLSTLAHSKTGSHALTQIIFLSLMQTKHYTLSILAAFEARKKNGE
jgi:hypothetical protein